MMPIQIALAAYGMSGEVFHAPLLMSNPDFRLTKVVSRQGDKIRKKYPDVAVLTDFDELLQDESIEVVVVNTPTHTHFDFARKALEAGKHVVVEKPFTATSAQAQALIDLAKDKNRLLTVFHNRRWDSGAKTIRKVIESELLGRLVEFELHFDRFRNFIKPATWKEETQAGSGVLYDLGVHLIDEALQLFGFPQKVKADIRMQRDHTKAIDSFLLILDYGTPLRVTLKVCYLVREPLPRYTLHGILGSFVKFGNDPQEDDLKAGKLPTAPDWGMEKEENYGILNTEINGLHVRGRLETLPGSYPDFYKDLYEAVRHGKTPAIQPEEAMQAIQVIEMALANAF